jgi:hypothetical protein
MVFQTRRWADCGSKCTPKLNVSSRWLDLDPTATIMAGDRDGISVYCCIDADMESVSGSYLADVEAHR